MSLTAILLAPTVAGLAAHVDRQLQSGTSSANDDSLAVLQPSGGDPPIFFLPGVGMHVMALRELAWEMGTGQRVYGLQPRGIEGLPPHENIHDMAAYLLEYVLQACPRGPISLVGFSAGGQIAYEMAQQLGRIGRTPGFLGLVDTYGPGYPRSVPLLKRLGRHARRIARLDHRGAMEYVGQRAWAILDRVRKPAAPVATTEIEDQSQRAVFERFNAAWLRGLERYVPQPYAGRVDVFRASDTPEWLGSDFDDPTCGWGSLVGDIHVRNVAGTHIQLVQPKGSKAQSLAFTLRASLREALGGSGGAGN